MANSCELLFEFLDNYKTTTQNWTHLDISTTSYYDVPDDKYDDFLELYSNAIYDEYVIKIVEKHKQCGPIVVDIDLVMDNDSDRLYSDVAIDNVVRVYSFIIGKYLNVSLEELRAYVLEKPEPSYRDERYNDGFHIIYPFICTDVRVQFYIRELVIKYITDKKKILFRKDICEENSIENIFDEDSIYYTPWMMFGSTKEDSNSRYQITKIYQSVSSSAIENVYSDVVKEIINTDDDVDSEYKLIRYYVSELSCRKPFDEIIQVRDDFVGEYNDIYKKIHLPEKKDNERSRLDFLPKNNFSEKEMRKYFFNPAQAKPSVVQDAKILLKMIPDDKIRKHWIQIGNCLHNTDDRLFSSWCKHVIGARVPKTEGILRKEWFTMKKNGLTLRTLHFMARKYNEEVYDEYMEEKISEMIHNISSGNNYEIAQIVMEKYGNRFVCAGLKFKEWFEFNGVRWIEIENGFSLSNLISREMPYLFDKIASEYKHKAIDIPENKDSLTKKAEMLSKIAVSLGNTTFKSGIMKECANISLDAKFTNLLNKNINLIGFENGVYDLAKKKFRSGIPDDYISKSTGYNFIRYKQSDPIVKRIYDFLDKIQTDKVLRDYLLLVLSTCLSGSIKEEHFYVLTGTGSNGKTKLIQLIKFALGDYYSPMDVRILTKERGSSSSASPELADKEGVRMCTLDEPGAKDELNSAFMKYMTGGDKMQSRKLYQAQRYWDSQMKLFMLCNKLPLIADDDGTWRRLIVIPFLSKFYNRADITPKIREAMSKKGSNIFEADQDLETKLPEWRVAFMNILLGYYEKYQERGLVHPAIVLKHTNQYKLKSDPILNFFTEVLEQTDDEKNYIKLQTLYKTYHEWFTGYFNGSKTTPRREFTTYLTNKIPEYDSETKRLKTYIIRPAAKDNDEEDPEE